MECPRCDERMQWESDESCEDAHWCECGEGIVSYYSCEKCNVNVELTTDCKGEKEEYE